jgi:hypothetical protein
LREVIFSHALTEKAKNILPKVYRCPNSSEGIGFVCGSTGWQFATGRIRRGEPVLFGSLAEKLLEGSEPKCPCKAVGGVAKLRFQGGAVSNPPSWSAD